MPLPWTLHTVGALIFERPSQFSGKIKMKETRLNQMLREEWMYTNVAAFEMIATIQEVS